MKKFTSSAFFLLLTFVVFVICAVLAAYQSVRSIMRYYEEAVVVSISERDLQYDDYPYVVLCSQEVVKKMAENISDFGNEYVSMFYERPELDSITNYPYETVSLQEYEEQLRNISIEYEYGLLGDQINPPSSERATRIYTSTAGMCLYIRPWSKTTNPAYININAVVKGFYWIRLVHNIQELGMFYSTYKMKTAFKNAEPFGKNVAWKLTMTQKTRVSAKDFKCSDDKAYYQTKCFDKCFSDALLQDKVATCAMPWMKVDIPHCSSNTTVKQLFSVFQEVSMEKYEETCRKRCLQSCTNLIYTLEDTIGKKTTNKKGIITLVINPTFKVVNEIVAYEFMNVVGDVGGIVGILLGFSIFGLFQMIIAFIQSKKTKTDTIA